MFRNVVMVCTGNICRSPYAEHVLKAKAPTLAVSSAGLVAMVGHSADETGLRVSKGRNIDIADHVARQLRSEMVTGADLVLVMDDGHLRQLLKKHPDARGKTFKLGKWLDNKNIADPYKRPADYFELVFDEIDKAVDSWLPHLGSTE